MIKPISKQLMPFLGDAYMTALIDDVNKKEASQVQRLSLKKLKLKSFFLHFVAINVQLNYVVA